MNKKIVKLLHPIQIDKRFKTRLMRLKIDSLIARLNKEFVGFYYSLCHQIQPNVVLSVHYWLKHDIPIGSWICQC